MSDQVSCQDCRHSFRPWQSFLFYSGPYTYQCRKGIEEAKEEFEPVTGKIIVTEAKNKGCVSMRSKYGECGVEGTLWEPKKRKDFLLYLKRV